MEAAGLAVGVVSLGLDLATRLQTYIEAVRDAGDRLSELSADVSATASIVRQIADLLSAHQQKPDYHACSAPSQPPILTARGVSDIEAQLRRCDKAYKVIIDILIRATSGAVNPPAFATAVGLSDLTASKLGKLASRAKWPWLEPRIKACQKQLKSIKVDLLLSLQIASLARHRLGTREENAEDREEGVALKDVAEKLIQKRAGAQETWNSNPFATAGAWNSNPWATAGAWNSTAPAVEGGISGLRSLTIMGPLDALDLDFTDLSNDTHSAEWCWNSPIGDNKALASSASLEASRKELDPAVAEAKSLAGVVGGEGVLGAGQPPVVQTGAESRASLTKNHLVASQEEKAREAKETLKVHQKQTHLSRRREPDTSNPWKRQVEEEEERLSTLAEKAEGISIGSLDDAEDLAAWFLVRDNRDGILIKLPVRGPTMHKTIKSCGAEAGQDSTLEQFLDLSSEHRAAVWDVMDCALKKDARARTLVGLYTRSSHPKLPRRAEVMVVVSTGAEEEVVNLIDLARRTWRLPYYALKTALEGPYQIKSPSGARYELARRCDYISPAAFQLSVDEDGHEGISLAGLYEHIRPGFRICMQKVPDDDTPPVTATLPPKQLNVLQRSGLDRPLPAPPGNVVPDNGISPADLSFIDMDSALTLADQDYAGFTSHDAYRGYTNSFSDVDWYSQTPAPHPVDPEAAMLKELFGDEETDGEQAGAGASVEELLAEWTNAVRTT